MGEDHYPEVSPLFALKCTKFAPWAEGTPTSQRFLRYLPKTEASRVKRLAMIGGDMKGSSQTEIVNIEPPGVVGRQP